MGTVLHRVEVRYPRGPWSREVRALGFRANTDTINCGSAASLDNLNTLTYLMLVRITANPTSLFGKGTAGTAPAGSRRAVDYSSSKLSCTIDYTTTDAYAEMATTDIVVGQWTWIAVTFTSVTNAAPLLYKALSGGAMTLIAPGLAINGVGTPGDNSSSDQFVGSTGAGTTGSNKDITCAAIYNRVLALSELQAFIDDPYPTPGCVCFLLPGLMVGARCIDYSGAGNHGTVSGAVPIAATVPLSWVRRSVLVPIVTGGPFPHYTRRRLTGGMSMPRGGLV